MSPAFFKGHFYRLSNTKKVDPRFSWRGVTKNCKITGKTQGKTIGEEYEFDVNHAVDHIDGCETEESDFILKERRRLLKLKASMADEAPRKILSTVANINFPESVLAKMPSYYSDRLVINREKKKSQPKFPNEPEKLEQVFIPDWLSLTKKMNNFCYTTVERMTLVVSLYFRL
ncbi:unnamed protein product [Brachionus calyciflorus]|uniref:Uncharacterized protein n=1 Tax=Brachionus calyciflorus TaxID=104777 RepID=A0A814RY20_9BILA|nr:unnamed protein product [Brachionus calyciflorus]